MKEINIEGFLEQFNKMENFDELVNSVDVLRRLVIQETVKGIYSETSEMIEKFSLEGTFPKEVLRKLGGAWYKEGDELAPFFSEAFLYNLVGKENARTILSTIERNNNITEYVIKLLTDEGTKEIKGAMDNFLREYINLKVKTK